MQNSNLGKPKAASVTSDSKYFTNLDFESPGAPRQQTPARSDIIYYFSDQFVDFMF